VIEKRKEKTNSASNSQEEGANTEKELGIQ